MIRYEEYIEKEMLGNMKVKPYIAHKKENLYAIIHIFDREVYSKDRFTDPDFFNYIDHPEGKHLVACSGQISNSEVVDLLRDIMSDAMYNFAYRKPKKWWQFWRNW